MSFIARLLQMFAINLDVEEGAQAPIENKIKQRRNKMAKLVIAKPAAVVAPKAAPKAAKAPKEAIPVPAADGKQCFEGTIGGSKYLFDAGNGEALAEITAGTPVADQAQAIGRTVVPRSKASRYAVNLLFRQWRDAKKPAEPTK